MKIGIYPGSFNPFHLGHLDIYQQASKVFDSVLLVKARNPKKPESPFSPIVEGLEFYRCDSLITSFVASIRRKYSSTPNLEVFLIRGIRNEYDVQAELNYQAWIKELDPSIDFVYFTCNPSYAKISSTTLRELASFGVDISKYLPKSFS